MNLHYSQHKIFDKDVCPFSEKEYSLFKFGDIFFAEKFAEELFLGFIEKNRDWVLNNMETIILPSPYNTIPTASNYLCHFFKNKLNLFLFENGKSACIESKIYRTQTYTEDYGKMNFDERINLISKDTYSIDKNFINGKSCVFLDDIKITGSHEYVIKKIIADNNMVGDFAFVYFAELCNMNIEPQIENYYNYFAIKNIENIIQIISKISFKFNTRIIKYILKIDKKDFVKVIKNLNALKQKELLLLSISNNYHLISEFQNNINFLNQHLWQSTYKKGKEKQLMPRDLR